MEGAVSVSVRRRVSGESHESIGTVPATSAESPVGCRHPYYPSLDIDWIMRFKDDKLEAEYQRYISKRTDTLLPSGSSTLFWHVQYCQYCCNEMPLQVLMDLQSK